MSGPVSRYVLLNNAREYTHPAPAKSSVSDLVPISCCRRVLPVPYLTGPPRRRHAATRYLHSCSTVRPRETAGIDKTDD